jgi:D-inositol-3-phosphate glycosyltransferase
MSPTSANSVPVARYGRGVKSARLALVSLHTSPLDPPGAGDAGGLNVTVSALADQLSGIGWEVEILTRRTDAGQPTEVRMPGGALVRFIDAGAPAPMPKEQLTAITREFRESVARLASFDVFHSHYWLSAEAVLPVARAQDAPHVLSLHTVAALKNARRAPNEDPEPAARLVAERTLCGDSDAVIASSRAEREAIVDYYEVDPSRVHVIEPGVDTALFAPLGHSADVGGASSGDRDEQPARSEVLVVGRIQPLKGQAVAIRALALIPREIRPRLALAGGSSGPHDGYLASLHRLVADNGLHDDVVFLGALSREQVAARMRRARLVLVPSSSETFGLVALEAAASGVPVVASRVAGLEDSVVDGSTGVLVTAGDVTAWAKAISSLLVDDEQRSALARGAADFGRGHSWHESALAISALYRRLIEGQP